MMFMNDKLGKEQVDRLLMAVKSKHPEVRNLADLSRILNTTQQNITNWINRGIPRSKTIEYSTKFGCSIAWLDKGDGEMTDGGRQDNNIQEEILQILGIDPSTLTIDRIEYLRSCAKVPDESLNQAKEITETFIFNKAKKKIHQ